MSGRTQPIILYEIRIFIRGQVSRRFADNLEELSALVKNSQDKKCRIYRIYKSLDGTILKSEELRHHLFKNTLVLKTIKTKAYVPKKTKAFVPKLKKSKGTQKEIVPAVSKIIVIKSNQKRKLYRKPKAGGFDPQRIRLVSRNDLSSPQKNKIDLKIFRYTIDLTTSPARLKTLKVSSKRAPLSDNVFPRRNVGSRSNIEGARLKPQSSNTQSSNRNISPRKTNTISRSNTRPRDSKYRRRNEAWFSLETL